MTDRTISSTDDLDGLDFTKSDGLIPVVAQDVDSRTVLMVAFANREALEASLTTGAMHFWSRSRSALWRKGETSGNRLAVRSLHADCDADTVLALVEPTGPSCHTGERTCFGAGASPTDSTAGASSAGATLEKLAATIQRRDDERPEGSYTTRLLDDVNLRLKKLGEENAELVVALATGNAQSATEEAADLVYHLLVALQAAGISLADLAGELEARAG